MTHRVTKIEKSEHVQLSMNYAFLLKFSFILSNRQYHCENAQTQKMWKVEEEQKVTVTIFRPWHTNVSVNTSVNFKYASWKASTYLLLLKKMHQIHINFYPHNCRKKCFTIRQLLILHIKKHGITVYDKDNLIWINAKYELQELIWLMIIFLKTLWILADSKDCNKEYTLHRNPL